MRKFTIFTIILTVIVLAGAADLFVNKYLPKLENGDLGAGKLELTLPLSMDLKDSTKTSVLGATGTGSELVKPEDTKISRTTWVAKGETGADSAVTETPDVSDVSSDAADFEDEIFSPAISTIYIRDEQLKSAGFVGAYAEEEPSDGFLFKTIYVGEIADIEVTKLTVRTADILLIKVYVYNPIGTMTTEKVYELLKTKCAGGLDVEINETNDFGKASFYMNDIRRDKVAFLTVKFSNLVYAFSYPKEYHPQVKNLIKLLEWELK